MSEYNIKQWEAEDKIIGEFMGWEFEEGCWWYTDDISKSVAFDPQDFKNRRKHFGGLPFRGSFDWLMQLVERIENEENPRWLKKNVVTSNRDMASIDVGRGTIGIEGTFLTCLVRGEADLGSNPRLQALYNCCLEYATWHEAYIRGASLEEATS